MTSLKNRVFPQLTPQDKDDRTTQVVKGIAEQDRLASENKTAKLKALRLARDADAPSPEPKPKKARL